MSNKPTAPEHLDARDKTIYEAAAKFGYDLAKSEYASQPVSESEPKGDVVCLTREELSEILLDVVAWEKYESYGRPANWMDKRGTSAESIINFHFPLK